MSFPPAESGAVGRPRGRAGAFGELEDAAAVMYDEVDLAPYTSSFGGREGKLLL